MRRTTSATSATREAALSEPSTIATCCAAPVPSRAHGAWCPGIWDPWSAPDSVGELVYRGYQPLGSHYAHFQETARGTREEKCASGKEIDLHEPGVEANKVVRLPPSIVRRVTVSLVSQAATSSVTEPRPSSRSPSSVFRPPWPRRRRWPARTPASPRQKISTLPDQRPSGARPGSGGGEPSR